MIRNGPRIVSVILLCFFSISCSGPNINITDGTVYEQPVAELESDYLLGPGDMIEVIYHVDPRPSKEEYVLTVGDRLLVEFLYHPHVNKEVEIRPDGKVTFPRKGDIDAAGITLNDFRQRVTGAFSDIFKDPVVTVTLLEYNKAINQIKEDKVVTIRPDGYLSLPLLEDIKAAGLTLPQLRAEANKRYRGVLQNLDVSLVLKQLKNNIVYVMGEVRKPDYYLMDGPTTLTQALVRAGGPLDTAELNTVLVISRNAERRPVGRVIDVGRILEEANIGRDIVLRQHDVVYLPKSSVARAGLFVDQYINRLIPQAFRAGFNAIYRLNGDGDDVIKTQTQGAVP